QIAELAQKYPDPYWRELVNGSQDRIDIIDDEHPLELLPYTLTDQMAITGIALSPDGTMLASFGSTGCVNIWDTDTFECLTTLRDAAEPNIDEFFVGQFTPNSEYLVVGGKLKDRKRWSEADEDNHIMPCPLKIFNVVTGEVVARLDGHSEEILCVKSVVYKEENYLVTTSQDGYIRRWHMDSDWVVLKESREITDGITCMSFTVSFIPNTGNRYFIAATDDHVTLMDLERCMIVQKFDPIYSSYCDSAEQPLPEPTGPYAYFVTRGVELLDAENNTVSSRPNTCTLHRLVYPTEPDGKFELQEIRRYHHEEYLSNSWLIRIASNGRYLLAPTLNGQVFVFHLATGQVTGILRDHE
ncbi:WD40-repeat-containing domain protein, partial [Coemansia mojavensis]